MPRRGSLKSLGLNAFVVEGTAAAAVVPKMTQDQLRTKVGAEASAAGNGGRTAGCVASEAYSKRPRLHPQQPEKKPCPATELSAAVHTHNSSSRAKAWKKKRDSFAFEAKGWAARKHWKQNWRPESAGKAERPKAVERTRKKWKKKKPGRNRVEADWEVL